METRWGLDLDMSAVRLMRRDGDNWVEENHEKIDSPDIEDRLKSLIEPIEAGAAVMLFLPREQILYTSVELDAAKPPRDQIERAMDGRTPYALDELSIDWETESGNTVRVAAIARDTLDEAAAFAEVRDLSIAGYSTLFSGADFPRLPRFDGPNIAGTAETGPDDAVAFTTARVPSRPPDAPAPPAKPSKPRFTPAPVAVESAPSSPVVTVGETTPVVQVKDPTPPLDPGLPIAAPNAPPRVRTDIAAASVSGHAASLTPPGGSVRVRKNRAPVSTLAVFAIAFLLTVGIAVLVWNFLPMRPGPGIEPPVDTGAGPDPMIEAPAPPLDTARTETPEEPSATPPVEPEVALSDKAPAPLPDAALPEVPEAPAPPLPDEPEIALSDDAPLVMDDVAATEPPSETDAPARPASPAETLARGSVGPIAMPEAGTLPEIDLATPLPPAPPALAAIQSDAPFLGPEPELGETSENVYLSAFELPDPATDAIALPNSILLLADDLPKVIPGAPPATPPEAPPEITRFNVDDALAEALAGPGGLVPTDLARSLTDRAPAPRPGQFAQALERQQFGGRTRAELARLRPPPRPASEQALAEAATAEASDLAVAVSPDPRPRPSGMADLVAAARVQQEAARVAASADIRSPDTSGAIAAALEDDDEPENRAIRAFGPSIPTTASVARTATIDNAIRLNQINLVGVYGAPADRSALVRLSSGRYVKVKVGDRIDGGTVARITDNQLFYRKGNRTLSLAVPQG